MLFNIAQWGVMVFADLGHQSQGRPLTEAEQAFAAALEAIYRRGIHDFGAVSQELEAANVIGPATGTQIWSPEVLNAELKVLNESLDEAYARDGIGA